MALPNSYTVKPGAISAYFDAIKNAEAPERFSNKFLVNLEFKSTNDRLFIGILKDLSFIDTDGVPKQRYYEFLDRSRSQRVLAEAIRSGPQFSDSRLSVIRHPWLAPDQAAVGHSSLPS